jgi:hypothetical protein
MVYNKNLPGNVKKVKDLEARMREDYLEKRRNQIAQGYWRKNPIFPYLKLTALQRTLKETETYEIRGQNNSHWDIRRLNCAQKKCMIIPKIF